MMKPITFIPLSSGQREGQAIGHTAGRRMNKELNVPTVSTPENNMAGAVQSNGSSADTNAISKSFTEQTVGRRGGTTLGAIRLATINARYSHASLGLRYLYANMGTLQPQTCIQEFSLAQRPEDIAEVLLSGTARIIGFGVYIWNVTETTDVIRLIKAVRPEIQVVIGGPEVSFEMDDQPITALADHLITGQADLAFAELCHALTTNGAAPARITPLPISLDTLASPYPHYTDEDIQNRILYVEASRGCPFKCEFCLSSLDKSATPFLLDEFLSHIDQLIQRGARQFKFVDRTFNLKAATGRRILEFFLSYNTLDLFLHFELIPDRLPAELKDLLPLFPPGSLQFEIGIQSFDPQVQALISRRQNHQKTCDNLTWLTQHTSAHIHADLIFGLPSETLDGFGRGFDLLYSLGVQEIQVGILKRLRGTPIDRHTQPYDMRYMTTPPYRILCHRDVTYEDMQRMVRFARYWDLIANAGRFPATLQLLLSHSPFARFLSLSDWLFAQTGATHKIALRRLFSLLFDALINHLNVIPNDAAEALDADYRHNRLKGLPPHHQQITDTNSIDHDASDVERLTQHQTGQHTTDQLEPAAMTPANQSDMIKNGKKEKRRHLSHDFGHNVNAADVEGITVEETKVDSKDTGVTGSGVEGAAGDRANPVKTGSARTDPLTHSRRQARHLSR